jgi:hypothetical protein
MAQQQVVRPSQSSRRAELETAGLSRALSLGQTHVTTHSMGTITHMPPEMFKWVWGRGAIA